MATARYIYTLSLSDENKWSVTGLIVDGNTNIASTSGDPNILGDVPNDYISLSGTVSGGMLYDGTLLNDSSALVSTGATSKILLTDVWYPAGSFVTVLPVDPVTGANQYDLVNDTAINVTLCYLRGTLILTDRGEVAIEDLSEGDLLVTRFGGLRPIRWIGRQSLHGQRAMGQEAILFMPGSLGAGMPRRPLRVSPGHSMLVGETLVLASDLVNGVTVTREAPRDAWEYVQVEFDSHDLILAEGAWSESFADVGTFRARFDNAAEFHARFPDHVAPQEPQLCAPRPESGPVLETALLLSFAEN